MPLRNRVDPCGEIVAVPFRGTMMGNRGRLHDDARNLVRTSQVDRWLCCQLSFRGRHRTVMAPRRYTELFFLDEATALAAGHRPCGECRNRAYQRFRQAWRDAGLSQQPPAPAELDARLARERAGTFHAPASQLPDGVMVRIAELPHLLWRGRLLRWSWTGYQDPSSIPASRPTAAAGSVPDRGLEVLTPPATVRTLAAGYPVLVHPSAAEVPEPTG